MYEPERLLLELAQQRMVPVREIEQRRHRREAEEGLERRERTLDDERGHDPVDRAGERGDRNLLTRAEHEHDRDGEQRVRQPSTQHGTLEVRARRDAARERDRHEHGSGREERDTWSVGVDEQDRHHRREHGGQPDHRVDQDRDKHRERTHRDHEGPGRSGRVDEQVDAGHDRCERHEQQRQQPQLLRAAPHEGLHARQVDATDADEQQPRRGAGHERAPQRHPTDVQPADGERLQRTDDLSLTDDELAGQPDLADLVHRCGSELAGCSGRSEVDDDVGSQVRLEQRLDDLQAGVARRCPQAELDVQRLIEDPGDSILADALTGEQLRDGDRLTLDDVEVGIGHGDQRCDGRCRDTDEQQPQRLALDIQVRDRWAGLIVLGVRRRRIAGSHVDLDGSTDLTRGLEHGAEFVHQLLPGGRVHRERRVHRLRSCATRDLRRLAVHHTHLAGRRDTVLSRLADTDVDATASRGQPDDERKSDDERGRHPGTVQAQAHLGRTGRRIPQGGHDVDRHLSLRVHSRPVACAAGAPQCRPCRDRRPTPHRNRMLAPTTTGLRS